MQVDAIRTDITFKVTLTEREAKALLLMCRCHGEADSTPNAWWANMAATSSGITDPLQLDVLRSKAADIHTTLYTALEQAGVVNPNGGVFR